jgi:hypothetical protein
VLPESGSILRKAIARLKSDLRDGECIKFAREKMGKHLRLFAKCRTEWNGSSDFVVISKIKINVA